MAYYIVVHCQPHLATLRAAPWHAEVPKLSTVCKLYARTDSDRSESAAPSVE